MSYCRKEGKDTVVFVTQEDHEKPSTSPAVSAFSASLEDEPGLITEEGDINWNCPCLGGMATGPCGFEFREAFSCFHYSDADPKGSDCFDQFRGMQECMAKYPDLYGDADKDEETEIAQEETDNLDSGESEINVENRTEKNAGDESEVDNTKDNS